MTKRHPDSVVIDALGRTGDLARLFGISPQAISQWRRNGIPSARMMYLELARPDLFLTKESKK